MFALDKSPFEYPIVAFDTETSGAYAIESEVIELGAVKYLNGKVIDQFQVLLKPKKLLEAANIKIHGITNEMLIDASTMSHEISRFHQFIDKSLLIAHHAPFDLGFMAIAFEKNNSSIPENLIFCTSLLSRALITSPNHKLQTLIKELNLVGGEAHRAYDDAYACLQVFLKCCEKIENKCTIQELIAIQKKDLQWSNYKVFTSSDLKLKTIAQNCEMNKSMSIVYDGGRTKSKPRPITPCGIVRNPDGDYVHAICGIDHERKRFYLNKILDYEI